MTHASKFKVHLALLAVYAAFALTACRGDDPDDLIRSARDYQAKGDHHAAIIQLKNALQARPDDGEARLLLGRSSLLVGDPVTAESEFRKALQSGQPPGTVLPLIANALLEGGEEEKVLAEFGARKLDDAQAEAELRARVGEAQLRTGKVREAATSFAAALASAPSNARARLGQARLAASEGKVDEALATAEQVAAGDPQSVDALLVLADLHRLSGNQARAREALERAVAASPSLPNLRFQLIAFLIAEGQFDAAAEQVSAARAIRTPGLQLQFFDAQIAFGRKDLAKARQAAQQVLKHAPGHVPALVLLGTVELQEQRFSLAESQLQSAVALAPQHMGARKILARSYLASGQPARALEVLRPVIESKAPLDAATTMLVGEAYFANGDLKQAASSFEAIPRSATQPTPQGSIARMRLSQIALASGDRQGGIRELESIVSGEGAPIQADQALIAGYVRQGETDKALAAARELVKKRPKDPVAHNTLGSVLVIKNQASEARLAFSKAVELDSSFMPALGSLARLDLRDGKPADARMRFESVLAKEPKNEVALLGLAAVLASSRAPSSEIAAILTRAIAANPGSVAPRVALVDLHLQNRDGRAALVAAQEAAASVGQDPRILDALGRAQFAAGETNQAIDTFNRAAAGDPQSTGPLMRLAAVYANRKEPEKAAEALLRAQRLAPGDAAVARELVRSYLELKKPDEALRQARALQKSAPESPAGFVLEGDVLFSAKQPTAAEKAYRNGLKAHPASATLALKLHDLLVTLNRGTEADDLSRKWLADHPKDATFRGYLGERAVRARDWKAAVAQYERVVALQPANPVALNNLAWALGQIGDPKALDYAERALQVDPDSTSVLDTIGVLLTQRGDAAKASEYLARAVALSPEQHEIRLHYAKALLKAGRAEEARNELTRLQAVSEDFPGKSEIAELLKR